MSNVYTQNGYKNRRDYLENLADDHGVHIDTVQAVADMLGENEDFDGRVTSIEDYAEMHG